MPRKFKLMAGEHAERDPNGGWKVYRKGAVIETDVDLCARHANKFVEIGRPSSLPADLDASGDSSGVVFDDPTPGEDIADKAASASGVIETESKHEAGLRRRSLQADGTKAKAPSPSEGEEGEEEEEGGEESLGTDVTDRFPGAEEGQLKVFKEGRHYHVANEGAPSVALNPGPLANKAAVDKFIKQQTG